MNTKIGALALGALLLSSSAALAVDRNQGLFETESLGVPADVNLEGGTLFASSFAMTGPALPQRCYLPDIDVEVYLACVKGHDAIDLDRRAAMQEANRKRREEMEQASASADAGGEGEGGKSF